MEARQVNHFERNSEPTKSLKIGDGRDFEDIVNDEIERVKEDDGFAIRFDDIREHVSDHYKDNPDEILEEIDHLLSKLPIKDRVEYWIGWHPGEDKK